MLKKSSETMVHQTLRLPQELLDATKLASKEAGVSMADYIRAALREAVGRREISSKLSDLEGRLKAQLLKVQRHLDGMHRVQQVQFTMLDEYMKVALALEPDIPDERAKAAARAIGFRRHRAIIESSTESVSDLLVRLMQSTEGNEDG